MNYLEGQLNAMCSGPFDISHTTKKVQYMYKKPTDCGRLKRAFPSDF